MRKSTHLILDMFFPRHCFGCRILLPSLSSSNYLCDYCFAQLPYQTVQRCAFCLAERTSGMTCRFCIVKHSLDALLVTADYQDQLTVRLVKGLKYRFIKSIANDIAHAMSIKLKKFKNMRDASLIPVPLHPKRLRWRGFNQAELIALHMSRELDIPLRNNILVRNKTTKPQAEIEDRLSRMKNVEGIFSATSVNDKTILLVDDVATTGATLDDAARALKVAGAKEVIGLVFARG